MIRNYKINKRSLGAETSANAASNGTVRLHYQQLVLEAIRIMTRCQYEVLPVYASDGIYMGKIFLKDLVNFVHIDSEDNLVYHKLNFDLQSAVHHIGKN